jgi:hypothetical protein
VYIAQGDNARGQAATAIEHVRRVCKLPIACIGDRTLGLDGVRPIYCENRDAGARWAKVNLYDLSPFDGTLYMDADTRVMDGSITAGFDMLADGWELVLTHSERQGHDWLWKVGDDERCATEIELGERLVSLQAGVMWWKRCANVERLFSAWREEWLVYRGQDQAALLRAMYKAPCRCYLLGRSFNGGSVVKHLFGRAR